MLHERFQRVEGYECESPRDLLAVADAAARLPAGLEAVQRAALDLAPFDAAPAQCGHVLLALLLAEGAVTLLLTNWDDCTERSRQRVELVPAARNQQEAEGLRGQFILKIHGCCTQSGSLLITSEQLRDPGLWTNASFQARLAESTMVFIGIGDVADYARLRITELAELVENARIRVVSRHIQRDWEASSWKEMLPDLPADRRIEKSAEDFLDELAREWVMQIVTSLREAGEEIWIDAVTAAFTCFTSMQALEWLRQATVGTTVGESVVRDPAAASLLEAVGLLAMQGVVADAEQAPDVGAIRFLIESAFRIDDRRFEAMICLPRQTAADIERAASKRANDYVARRGPTAVIDVLVSASDIRGQKPEVLPAVSVVDPDRPVDDLLAEADQVQVNLIYANELLATV